MRAFYEAQNVGRCRNYDSIYQNGNTHLLSVNVLEAENYQSRQEQAEHYGIKPICQKVVAHEYSEKNNTCHKLDYHISGSYLSSAGTASSSEYQPAEHGDKVITLYLRSAGHTVGIVGDEGFTFRKSVDTDIQKASYAYSEKEHENIGDDCHYGFQGLKAQAAHFISLLLV